MIYLLIPSSSSHPHCCSSLPRSLQQPPHWSYYIQHLHPTSLIFITSPREFLKQIWDTITLLLKNAPWQKLNQSNAVQFWVSWGRNECMLPVEMCTGIGFCWFFFFNNLAIFIQMKNTHMAHLASAISALETFKTFKNKSMSMKVCKALFFKNFSRILENLHQ